MPAPAAVARAGTPARGKDRLAAQGHGMLRERDWVATRRSLGIWCQVEFDVDAASVAEETAAASAAGPDTVASEATVAGAAVSQGVPEAPAEAEAVPSSGESVGVPAGAHFSRNAGLALVLPLMSCPECSWPRVLRANRRWPAQGN